MSVDSLSILSSVKISAVKSGADFLSFGALGVCVAIRVYAGNSSLWFRIVSILSAADWQYGSRIPNARELCLGGVPHLHGIDIVAHQILKMCSQGSPVVLERARSFWSHALRDLDDDAREAILVDVDFLVVGDFAELTTRRKDSVSKRILWLRLVNWSLAHT
jgi:hypothetical protein